jgi:hypothetical protein
MVMAILALVIVAVVITTIAAFHKPEGCETCRSINEREIGKLVNWQTPITVYPSQSATPSGISQDSSMVKRASPQSTSELSSSPNIVTSP